jgi:hypothetical protein
MTDLERLKHALADATFLTDDEKAEYIEGAAILLDLGWPLNFDYRMAQRAIAGLVPKYEGFHSFLAYQAHWAREDQAAALKQRRSTEAAAN